MRAEVSRQSGRRDGDRGQKRTDDEETYSAHRAPRSATRAGRPTSAAHSGPASRPRAEVSSRTATGQRPHSFLPLCTNLSSTPDSLAPPTRAVQPLPALSRARSQIRPLSMDPSSDATHSTAQRSTTPTVANQSAPRCTATTVDRDTLGRFAAWNSHLPAPLSRHTLVFLAAGAMARATSATLTSPLDSVKVRVQFSQRGLAASSSGVVPYSGALQAARAMWTTEGPAAFYRGLPARLVYIVPAAAISFVFYEQFRALYHASPEQRATRSVWALGVPLLLGGIARVAGTAVRTPFDVIKQRMQIQGSLPKRAEQLRQPVELRAHGIYANSAEALQQVSKVEGIRALWSGLGATILRDIPFAATYFVAYETSKTLQIKLMGPHDPPIVAPRPATAIAASSPQAAVAAVAFGSSVPALDVKEHRAAGLSTPRYMLSGAFAAACAVTVTMPMDCVKTRLQTQGSLPENMRYSGILHCARSVYAESGVRGFWKGTVPRLLYLAPASATTFALYELYKRHLQTLFDGHDAY